MPEAFTEPPVISQVPVQAGVFCHDEIWSVAVTGCVAVMEMGLAGTARTYGMELANSSG